MALPSLQLGTRLYATSARGSLMTSSSPPSGHHDTGQLARRTAITPVARSICGCLSQSTPLLSSPATQTLDTASQLSSSSPSLSLSSSPLSSSSRPAPKRPPRRKKVRKKKIRPQRPEGLQGGVPKQSSYTTRILFQSIAPHVETRTLNELMKNLSRIVSRGHHKHDTQCRDGKEKTLKRRVAMMFEAGATTAAEVDDEEGQESGGELEASDEKYSWRIRDHPWIQQIVVDYFMGKLLDRPIRNAAKPLPIDDPTYPPIQNRQRNYEDDLGTLIKARRASISLPIFWTKKSLMDYHRMSKKRKEAKQEGHEDKLTQHSLRSDDELRSEAESLLQTLITRLPPHHLAKLMELLDEFVALNESSTSMVQPDIPLKDTGGWQRMLILGSTLKALSPSHSHMVGVELGRYLNVDLPEPIVVTKGVDEKGQTVGRAAIKAAALAIRKQPELHTIEKKYHKKMDEFVKKMTHLQHEFASWDKASDTDQKGEEELDGVSQNNDEDDDDGDVSPDLMVAELGKRQLAKEQQEELTETLVELRNMGLRKDGDVLGKGRPRKGVHLHFSAIKLVENEDGLTSTGTDVHEQLSDNEAELEERVVFINNLPIDIKEEEIDQIYSRCGPLESIELFNLRPDLDPGLMTKKQLRERRLRNKIRNKDLFQSLGQYQKHRPRTPVYGKLRFQSAEGYKVATSSELCLFGCVIRRHPVLSIKHRDVTKLYLEQIPSNLYSMDVEYKLAQLFQPHKVCVMLDGMKGVGMNGSEIDINLNGDRQDLSHPSSCQIQFEDFHAASQAHQWLRQAESSANEENGRTRSSVEFIGGDGCQVHWFRTPENSMGYWTRELTF